jgi:PTH2 family peptidyl-tRNA hydrolase
VFADLFVSPSHLRRFYSQAKIALKASSEEEILELEAIAKSLNLCARSVQDA